MKWINSEESLPKHGVSVLVEYRSGSYVKMEFSGSVPKDWWERNIIRWLDESEPSFTIEDIKLAYNTGWSRGYNHNYDEVDKYLKQQYNIDINK